MAFKPERAKSQSRLSPAEEEMQVAEQVGKIELSPENERLLGTRPEGELQASDKARRGLEEKLKNAPRRREGVDPHAAHGLHGVFINGSPQVIQRGTRHTPDLSVDGEKNQRRDEAARRAVAVAKQTVRGVGATVQIATTNLKYAGQERAEKAQIEKVTGAIKRTMKAEAQEYKRTKGTQDMASKGPETHPTPVSPLAELKDEIAKITREHALREESPESVKQQRAQFRAKLEALLEKYAPVEERTVSEPAEVVSTIPEIAQAPEREITSTKPEKVSEPESIEELAARYQVAMDGSLNPDTSEIDRKVANRARLQAFIENARRVNEKAAAERVQQSAESSAPAPEKTVQQTKEQPPIVMLNSILSKQAGLKGVKPPVFGAEPDRSPAALGALSSALETPVERAQKPKRTWRKWFGPGGGGVVGAALLALFAHGDRHETKSPQEVHAVRLDVSKQVAAVRSSAEAPHPVQVAKEAPVKHVPAQEAFIEKGEGADILYRKLMKKLEAAYADPTSRPPLVQKLFAYKDADTFSREMKFEKIEKFPQSYPMHKKDAWHAYADTFRLSEDGETLVYVDTDNTAHVLMEMLHGEVVLHPQENLPMRPYGQHSYHVQTKKIEHTYSPQPTAAVPQQPPAPEKTTAPLAASVDKPLGELLSGEPR